jgi:hypothetical protein
MSPVRQTLALRLPAPAIHRQMLDNMRPTPTQFSRFETGFKPQEEPFANLNLILGLCIPNISLT